MSLQVIKAGLLDSFQDIGRFGYEHLGIPNSGAMDRHAAALANCLLGNNKNAPVLECHFPAARFLFTAPAVICITGAQFRPVAGGQELPLNRPVALGKNTELQFRSPQSGARCYIAFLQPPVLESWLGSFSTNFKAGTGGYRGRALQTGDHIDFEPDAVRIPVADETIQLLPWKIKVQKHRSYTIGMLPGPEWNWIGKAAREALLREPFYMQSDSDRMGIRLNGVPLPYAPEKSLVSSAVNFGTLQLLPSGQMIVLMADHQTTGGYPRIASVISHDLCRLAQLNRGATVQFRLVSLAQAEQKHTRQQQYLDDLQEACSARMASWLGA